MKQDFKRWLMLHKGKTLTKELIDTIANRLEDEIGDMLYNQGLCLESMDTGKNIVYGDCEGDNKMWAVQDMWNTEREFVTLNGAINYACQ